MIISHTAGAQPRRARLSTSKAALSGASLLAIASVLVAAPNAKAQSILLRENGRGLTPPAHDTVDANGVDLATGLYNPPQMPVSIGPSGKGGLTQTFLGNGPFDNLTVTMIEDYPDNQYIDVNFGGRTDRFLKMSEGEEFGSERGTGSALALVGGIYRYTDRDGARTYFEVGDLFGQGSRTLFRRANRTERPDGEIIHYNYVDVFINGYPKSHLGSVSNNLGYKIEYSHDAQGNLLRVRGVDAASGCSPLPDACPGDPASPQVTLDGNTITDATGRSIQTVGVRSDENGDAFHVILPGGRSTLIERDRQMRVHRVTTPAGVWNYRYFGPYGSLYGALQDTYIKRPDQQERRVTTAASSGQIFETCDEVQRCTRINYDGQERVQRVTNPEGDATDYQYGPRNNVVRATSIPRPSVGGANLEVSAEYPVDCSVAATCNQPTKLIDARGKVTEISYFDHGGVKTITSPANEAGVKAQQRFTYTPLTATGQTGAVFRLTGVSECATTQGSEAGCPVATDEVVTQTSYTAANLLPASMTISSGSTLSGPATTSYGYDRVGNLTSIDGPLTSVADVRRFRYDPLRRLVAEGDPAPDAQGMRVRKMTYNEGGELQLLQQGTVTNFDADLADTTQWARPGFSLADYETLYDGAGRKVVEKASKPGEAPVSFTEYSYDPVGRLKCVAVRMNPAAFAQGDACTPTTLGSNGPDRIAEMTYDVASRLTSVVTGAPAVLGVQAADQVTRSFDYDGDGLMRYETDGKANRTNYKYDGHSRLQEIVFPDSNSGQASASSTSREYEYDGAGEKTREKLRDGTWISFPRDDRGQVKSNSADGATFKYDNDGRVTEAKVAGQAPITNTYDGRGNLIVQTGPLGGAGPQGSVRYEYDTADRRTRMEWPDGYFVTYDYDAAGKLKEIKAGGTQSLATFSYDARDLRTRVDRGNGVSTSYGFGAAARQEALTHERGPTQIIGYTFQRNPAGQIVGTTSSNSAWNQTAADPVKTYDVDRLNQYTRIGAKAPGYSMRGNLTHEDASAAQSYDYDAFDRLTIARGSTFTYDGLGRLASTNGPSGVRRFVFDGVDLIAVYDGANTLLERYVHGPGVDEPLVSYDSAGVHWLLADQLGSVVASTNSTGAVEAKASFDDYGQGAPVSRFGFTGQAWLPDAQLYHFKARAYAPQLGRFLQPDPAGTAPDESLYRYALNDPVNASDPSGQSTVSELIVNAVRNTATKLARAVTYSAQTVLPPELGGDATTEIQDLIQVDSRCKSSVRVTLFKTSPALLGHLGISIDGAPSRGFYTSLSLAAIYPGTHGHVEVDTLPVDQSETIPVNSSQAAGVKAYLDSYATSRHGNTYTLTKFNCAGICAGALAAVGIRNPSAWPFNKPDAVFSRLVENRGQNNPTCERRK